MTIIWEEADEKVLEVASGLIEKYHPWLKTFNVAFVFRGEAQISKGKMVLGHAEKVSDKLRAFLDFHFLIWIAKMEFLRLHANQQEALIDHELCHCSMGPGGPTIAHHDIDEFRVIVERHGFWSEDLKAINASFEAARQLTIPGTETIEFRANGKVATLTGEQLHQLANNPGGIQDLRDELLEEAMKLRDAHGKVTISNLQRHLRIGYSRAAKLKALIETAEATK